MISEQIVPLVFICLPIVHLCSTKLGRSLCPLDFPLVIYQPSLVLLPFPISFYMFVWAKIATSSQQSEGLRFVGNKINTLQSFQVLLQLNTSSLDFRHSLYVLGFSDFRTCQDLGCGFWKFTVKAKILENCSFYILLFVESHFRLVNL